MRVLYGHSPELRQRLQRQTYDELTGVKTCATSAGDPKILLHVESTANARHGQLNLRYTQRRTYAERPRGECEPGIRFGLRDGN